MNISGRAAVRILSGVAGDRRGLTLIEICIGLLLMSVGLVSILALFPKALQSTRRMMEVSTAASVGRSAMAQLTVEALDDRMDNDEGIAWNALYDGGSADPQWWPTPPPEGVTLSGKVQNWKIYPPGSGSSEGDSLLELSDIGTWQTSSPAWNEDVTNYFVLMTSGGARGALYRIHSVAFNENVNGGVSAYGHDTVTVDGTADDSVNVEVHGVRAEDTFRIVGTGCIGPVEAVGITGERFFSWVAVVQGDSTIGVPGMHDVIILIYGRDFGSSDLSVINCYRPVHYFAGIISEPGK